MTKIAFHTLGCKLNFSETSTIARDFKEQGYDITDFGEVADIYVIHTCSVTSVAEKKCRSAIQQAIRRNPDSKIAVIGCYAQLRPENLQEIEGVNLILGNAEKFDLRQYIESNTPSELDLVNNKYQACHIHTSDIQKDKKFAPSYSSGDRTRTFLKIQDGCNYYCTYCTIPHARGHSRSAGIADTIALASKAAMGDAREFILTGVNIGDYGHGTNENFFDLLTQLVKVKGMERIRISSIEPELLDDDIINMVASNEKLMPHFHIPLQSGSDTILNLMKRKYVREVFYNRVEKIKKLMPHACIAADVIVGFPGETDELFQETFTFLEQLDISYLHVFSYSERPGTIAENLPNKVSSQKKQIRSKILHSLSGQKMKTFYAQNESRIVNVLFESDRIKGFMHGFSENYIKVKTAFNPEYINKIVTLRLENPDSDGIFEYKPSS
ncbi:MAG: tRNA (N(6)-L-threonylcarbamoyladenosine(37)-C(2))-methylthiotransferase MtaB [Bacteroidales bacterium]|nr:tRNA (N(6)-L-threonylcarbamoyladenosine(37)-C(2))-methylthiotransferase MtaB [Bacteroidales bacterium]